MPRTVKVVETENGKVPIKVLLGLGAEAEADLASRPSHHDLEGEHDHEDFDTFIVDIASIANPDELAKRVATAAEQENVLRVKGFVEVGGKPMRLLPQCRRPARQSLLDRAWTAEDDRCSRPRRHRPQGLNR